MYVCVSMCVCVGKLCRAKWVNDKQKMKCDAILGSRNDDSQGEPEIFLKTILESILRSVIISRDFRGYPFIGRIKNMMDRHHWLGIKLNDRRFATCDQRLIANRWNLISFSFLFFSFYTIYLKCNSRRWHKMSIVLYNIYLV